MKNIELKYEALTYITKVQFEQEEKFADNKKLAKLLYGVAFCEEWEWAEDIYLKYLFHDDIWIVRAALECFTDLARTSRINHKKVIKELQKFAKSNDSFKTAVNEVVSEIKFYKKKG